MTANQPRSPKGVFIVAAEPLLRLGLARAIEAAAAVAASGASTNRLVPVGTAGDARTAHAQLTAISPPLSILVLNPLLPDATLEGACGTLIQAHPGTAATVLLSQPDRVAVRLVCRLGARGVFDTSVEPAELIRALGEITGGGVAVQPSLIKYLLDAGDEVAPSASVLTEREIVAFQLLARGYTSKEIAVLVRNTPKAVDQTIERATRRLGATHRTQGVAIAIKRGLIE